MQIKNELGISLLPLETSFADMARTLIQLGVVVPRNKAALASDHD
jgi:hypothetical protein